MAQPEPGISGSGKEEETQTTTTTTPREILYKEGSVITDTRYFVWQADEAERQSVCGRGLSMPGKPMARCSGCKVVHYCSKICQKEDWSDRHKEECKLYRDWNSMEHSVETHAHRMFLLALKAVIRLKKEGPDSDFYRLPYDATKLIRPPGSDIITDKPYRTVDPDGVVIKDLDDFSRILGRVTQNWVPGLVDYSLEVTKVGKAVLVPLKTIEWGDTCQANAILAVPPVRPDFKLVSSKPSRIIATRDIYVGEKVVLERFENFGTLAQRQYGHLEMFGRKCVCHMCTDPAEAERNALKCKNSRCTAAIPSDERANQPCTACGQDNTGLLKEGRKVMKLIGIFSKPPAADSMFKTSFNNLYEVLRQIFSSGEPVLHPTNLSLGMMYRDAAMCLAYHDHKNPAFMVYATKCLAIMELYTSKYYEGAYWIRKLTIDHLLCTNKRWEAMPHIAMIVERAKVLFGEGSEEYGEERKLASEKMERPTPQLLAQHAGSALGTGSRRRH